MCGIVGYLGKKEQTISILITGLKALEYRGYDSAGIAYQKNNKIKVIKSVGRLEQLKKKSKIRKYSIRNRTYKMGNSWKSLHNQFPSSSKRKYYTCS